MKIVKALGHPVVLGGFLLALIISALPLVAQQEPLATITVESVDIPEGQEATVTVTVTEVPAPGVVSIQGTIPFDPNVIEVVRVEFREDCPVHAFNVEPGLIRFAATKCVGEEGEGILEGEIFRLVVRATGPVGSSTTLRPVFDIFHDPKSTLIPHKVVPGVIRIVAGTNELPTADFVYTPLSPSTRDTIQFMDRSVDPDGRITQWLWDFGDGATADTQTPSHQYGQGGLYTITLTVTDNRGGSAEIAKRIYVFQAPPPDSVLVLNYPNPASTRTTFVYFLPVGTTRATLLIFDLVGRPAFTTDLDVNRREFVWDLRDGNGNDLPNGPYFYLVRAETPRGVVSSRVEVLVIQR